MSDLSTNSGGAANEDLAATAPRDVVVSAEDTVLFNGPRLSNVASLVSGAAFGVGVAALFRGSIGFYVLSGLGCAILTVLAGGLRRFVLGGVIVLAACSAALAVTALVFPSETWSMRWLGPLAILALTVVLIAMRHPSVGKGVVFRWQVHALELLSGASALAIALLLQARVATAGVSLAGNFLMFGEDNDAWLNVVARSPSPHAVTAVSAAAQGTFGPVAPTYLAFLRTLETGVFPGSFDATSVPMVVLIGYFALLVVSPTIVATFAARLVPHRRFADVVFAWLAGTFILGGTICVLAYFGFLTACLALVLVLCAALLYSALPTLDVSDAASLLRWSGLAVVIFAVAAVWVPLIPAGSVVIAALCLVSAMSWIRDRSFRLGCRVAAGWVLAGILGFALLHQYRVVVGPLGGGASTLLNETGGTPTTTPLVEALCVVLLGAVYVTTIRKASEEEPRRGLLLPMLYIAGFLTLVLLAEAWAARTTSYGSEKLSVVLLSAMAILGLFQLLSSAGLFADYRGSGAALVIVVVLALTFQQGPLYIALANHWPTPQGTPTWLAGVDQQVAKSREVLCLQPLNTVVRSDVNLDAYWCTRWATSVAGLDNQLSLDWRHVLLGAVDVPVVLSEVAAAPRGKVVVLVIGTGNTHVPSAWWAPLNHLSGVSWVRVPG